MIPGARLFLLVGLGLAVSGGTAPATPGPASAPARSSNAFGLDLFERLPDTGNLFFSPYSIHAALWMTYSGAAGRTSKDMAKALRLPGRRDSALSGFGGMKRPVRPPPVFRRRRIRGRGASLCRR